MFDSFGLKRPFLAGGYRGGGRVFWRRGQRIRAAEPLSRAVWMDPANFAQALLRNLPRLPTR